MSKNSPELRIFNPEDSEELSEEKYKNIEIKPDMINKFKKSKPKKPELKIYNPDESKETN